MTTISGLGRAAPLGSRAGPCIRQTGFTVPESTAAPADAEALAGAAPLAALGSMLAFQEAETERAQNRAARRRGEAILEELARLQRALLGSTGGTAALERLAGLAHAPPSAADPALTGILEALSLRARVELARRATGPETTLGPAP